LAAKVLLAFLFDHDDPFTGVRQLSRRDQPGKTGPYDNDIRIRRHDVRSPAIAD
jgi:hypothetical protein